MVGQTAVGQMAEQQSIDEMAAAARRYCAMIEQPAHGAGPWLEQVAQLLPRVHAAVVGLGNCGYAGELRAGGEHAVVAT